MAALKRAPAGKQHKRCGTSTTIRSSQRSHAHVQTSWVRGQLEKGVGGGSIDVSPGETAFAARTLNCLMRQELAEEIEIASSISSHKRARMVAKDVGKCDNEVCVERN